MDDWSKSVEGVSAKVKQLDSVLKAQKSKLAGLTAEYEKVAKEQGAGSEAARKLKVQINNQQSIVNKTQKEFNNYTDTLKQAKAGTLDLAEASLKGGKAVKSMGDGAKESSSKMGAISGVAKGVAGGVTAVVGAAGAAVGSFLALGEATQEYREDMSRLDAAFEASGKSAESAEKTYTTLFRAIGESDTAVEASQQIALLAESEEEAAKWAGLATGVVGTFGDALKPEVFFESANETIKLGEATGAYVQMLEGTGMSVEEFNAGLAACTTESEKQAYMLKVSEQALGGAGKAYEEQAGSILDAREASANLTDALAELGAVAEPIMTTLKQLAADLLKEMQPFVELIGEGLSTAFAGGSGGAEKLAEGLGGILNMLVEKVNSMLPTILNIILELIPQLANTLLSATPQLLSVVIQLVTQILNMLSEILPQIVIKVSELLPLLINSLISAIPQLLEAAITLIMAIVSAIPVVAKNLISALPSIVETIISVILQAIPLLLNAAIQLLMAIIDAIPTIINAIVRNLPKIINAIINGVLEALPLLLDAAITLLMAIVSAIPKILPPLLQTLPKVISTIVSTLGKNAPEILTAALDLFMQIVKAIPKIAMEILSNMPEIISAVVSGLAEGASDLAEAGLDMVKGIWDGIKDGAGWIKDKISGFAGDVAGWFKKAFKIKSPSRLMADEVGKYIGEGIGVGVLDSMPTVKKQLGEFAGFIQGNLGDIKSGLSVGVNGTGSLAGAGAGRNTVVNAGLTIQYNGRLSRKQIKQEENDYYSAIKTKLRAEGHI